MIVTENLFIIEDQTEALVQEILASESFTKLKIARQQLQKSVETQKKQTQFLIAKQEFEQIEAYGKYAPDFRTKQRAVRQAKRALDLQEEVAEFRYAETNVQTLLDTIGQSIARTISAEIKVTAGNPFFEKGNQTGCGGNCHAS